MTWSRAKTHFRFLPKEQKKMSSTCRLSFVSVVLASLVGCGAKSLSQKLTGKWVGAPDISGELEQYVEKVKQTTDDPEAVEVTRSLAEFTGKIALRKELGVDLHLNSTGELTLTGKTGVFGMQGNQIGTWQAGADKDVPILTLKVGDQQFPGKITWRDEDAFFFQYEAPLKATTSLSGDTAELSADAKTKPATLLFRRMKY